MKLSRAEYARQFGPTTGDLLRLGDTDLWVRVEADDVGYGDEPVWGYAKNWRSRQAQDDRPAKDSELDMLIAGVVIIDPFLGVRKTSIGIKDGRIAGIGRAGNPGIMTGTDLTIGPNTWPVNGYGLIATAGAVDSHVHLITPRLVPVALSAGVTTLITAGFEEPPYVMDKTLRAFEFLPVNLGLQASARTDAPGQLDRVLEAGACGLKIHEDWGAYPEIIDATLRFADQHDIAVCLHTDGLNEAGELPDTIDAIGGRSVHAYHVEGAGGGHIPDLIGIVAAPSVVCSSTTPTVPYGRAAAAEHLEMILLSHGGSPDVPHDVEIAAERVHPASMAAEGPLHELGAISIINSDSQGMGRIGETIRRTWQLAHAMKHWRQTGARAGLARRRPGRAPPTTTRGCSATWPSTRPSRPGCTGSRPRLARCARGGWRTSCCGGPGTSGSARNWCSRAAGSPGARSAPATPRSRAPSRAATEPTGPARARPPPSCRSRSCPPRRRRPASGSGWPHGAASSPSRAPAR